jgi:D-xylose transport system permease protein
VTTADPQAVDAVPEPSNGLGAIIRRRIELLRAGDVGNLPIVLGLILIVAFFYWKNENYLSAGNFTNLMTQMAGVTTIAIGVVFVLLLGEIDLSIGYVAGVAGVVVAELQIPDESW